MKQTQESLSASYRFFFGVIGKWGFDVKGTAFINLIGGCFFLPHGWNVSFITIFKALAGLAGKLYSCLQGIRQVCRVSFPVNCKV